MAEKYHNSVFLIDIDRISPNPYQPRREFNEVALRDLANSIAEYGVLQPLTVSRKEIEADHGGLTATYELIAGERRLRASKIAGLQQVPAIIRQGDDSKVKLELAIIENLQREDLNVVDRAVAFQKLIDEFHLTQIQIGAKVGKSREYVANTIRILRLPEYIRDALVQSKLTEGHTRPLLMLADKPQEQETLFKEIVYKKISVREAERISRRVAQERVRKQKHIADPEVLEIEERLAEKLGTRVHIEKGDRGGTIVINFFTNDDLHQIDSMIMSDNKSNSGKMLSENIELLESLPLVDTSKNQTAREAIDSIQDQEVLKDDFDSFDQSFPNDSESKDDDDDLYNIDNFKI